MTVVTEPDTAPTPLEPPDPGARGIVLADLAGRLILGYRARARHYEAAAREAEGELRLALEALGRAKHAQAGELAEIAPAPALEGPPPAPAAAPASPGVPAWGSILGEAFQGERGLERLARELATLAQDAGLRARATRLARRAAQDAASVRKLYLRYS